MKINTIITGTTGMVGKGVLIECLESSDVDSILIINRKSLGLSHPKLKEVLLSDFTKFDSITTELKGYNACFHCMGVSSIGKSEEEFNHFTYTMTQSLVDAIAEVNPKLVFNYVSGAGTDSSEKGRVMWARVKGKTENLIFNKGIKDAYAFRPGAIIPEKGVKSKTSWYNGAYVVLKPLFPLFKKMNSITTSSRLGQAMINSVLRPQSNKFLENPDINKLAL
ncbi:MAG: NAD-dependent epimerase/dehydratase family protein [Bacteroidales bacterium]|jgi:nucleoside-diphosphate-sugar epimerase|nr:NAD-dependent epimerase/dehydratase family protein [Bacteroidales bacterium]